jgi:acetyl esterase
MSLDPDVQQLLDEFAAGGLRDFADMTVLEARSLNGGFDALQGDGEDVASVREILVDGAAGRLPARVYHPRPGHQLPVLVYFHGGGWVIGNLDVVDKPIRALANAAGCVVVTVQYRISPETKFPGAPEDCYAATAWVAAHAAELGADAGRLAVGGDSAGGNLAAAVALLARDRGTPSIAFQLLIYPTVAPAENSEFDSYTSNGHGYMTTAASMRWFYQQYLADPAGERDNPYAFPLRAKDLRGLPPAHVVTAQYDPLHDEGVAYATALAEAGVETTTADYSGVIHGFFWMPARIAKGRTVAADMAQVLRERLVLRSA